MLAVFDPFRPGDTEVFRGLDQVVFTEGAITAGSVSIARLPDGRLRVGDREPVLASVRVTGDDGWSPLAAFAHWRQGGTGSRIGTGKTAALSGVGNGELYLHPGPAPLAVADTASGSLVVRAGSSGPRHAVSVSVRSA